MNSEARPSPIETLETVFRIESGRIVAGAARVVRDLGLAEELAQDAMLAALEQWPESGVPDNPGAWLTAAAKNRAVDLVRRKETYARKLAELGRRIEDEPPPEPADLVSDDIDDDLLRLIFTACHPVLSAPARAALTLRLFGGLSTEEIARAFLASEAAIAQRIVRAKRTLAASGVRFEVPSGAERETRLTSVLEVVYLIFNEGYSATAGTHLLRPALCEDALRLARSLRRLLPDEPEVAGLEALLELQSSRFAARADASGEPVLLADQDRGTWNRAAIVRGLEALRSAGDGPYATQAAIAACHAAAPRFQDTDWAAVARLYGRLARLTPSPVVELNRAVAVSMAEGPAAGLELVDQLVLAPELTDFHLLPSVRADLLSRLGRSAEAAVEFERAASLTKNESRRRQLAKRAEAARAESSPHSVKSIN